jgi:hypothetical protein
MRNLRSLILLLMLVPGAAGAATLGEAQIGFSADRTLVIDGRKYLGKIWTMPGRERHEQAIQGLRPILQFTMPPELRLLGNPQLKKHPVGKETVNGIATTKYVIDETVPEGRAEGALWLSRDGIPMRLAGSFTRNSGKVSTLRWELNHVKIGPQPAALFEAPKGFSKLPPEAVAPLLGLKLKSTPH